MTPRFIREQQHDPGPELVLGAPEPLPFIFEGLSCVRQYAKPVKCLLSFDPLNILPGQNYCSCFTRKEIKAQRGEVSSLGSHSNCQYLPRL